MITSFQSTWYRGNISSRFCSNSEAGASELLQNLEETFPRYLWMSIEWIRFLFLLPVDVLVWWIASRAPDLGCCRECRGCWWVDRTILTTKRSYYRGVYWYDQRWGGSTRTTQVCNTNVQRYWYTMHVVLRKKRSSRCSTICWWISRIYWSSVTIYIVLHIPYHPSHNSVFP